MNHLEAVREFHRTLELPTAERPSLSPAPALPHSVGVLLKSARDKLRAAAEDGNRLALRLALEVEELHELFEALEAGSLPAALDAQVDRLYVLHGTNLELGFGSDVGDGLGGPGYRRFDRAFARVHAANLAKAEGGIRKSLAGKVLKPEGWRAPQLADLCGSEAGPV